MKAYPRVLLVFIIGSLLFLQHCAKEDPAMLPTVLTGAAADITYGSVTLEGTISSNGGAKIMAKGFTLGTSHDPTITRDKIIQGSGSPQFVAIVSDLSPNTTYYARAYATNRAGTAYGQEIEFITDEGLPEIALNISTLYNRISLEISVVKSGASTLTEIGVCYGTTQPFPDDLDQNNRITFVRQVPKPFENYSFFDLAAPSKIYYRAYGVNSQGVAYGPVQEANTIMPPSVTDGDNNIYPSTVINGHVWMAENMKSTKYMNGDPILTATNDLSSGSETEPAYQWVYNNIESNASTYGRLYTYYAATDPRKLCPSGWHIPTLEEVNTLGPDGNILMTLGTSTWNLAVGSNPENFSAVGAGARWFDGTFVSMKDWMALMTTTTDPGSSFYIKAIFIGPDFERFFAEQSSHKFNGISVRCVLD